MPLFQDISTPDFDRIREVLHRLAANPPQVLLLEGGTEPQRLAAARYWAACVNCQQPGGEGGPCLICPTCMQIDAGEHLDVLAYDGRISNADDEAHPGPIRALNMDNIRELKQKLRDAPHGQGRRVVLLMGVEQNRSNAANALLKALEEPSPSSCFVLLAAQREQLLPTLVSRSLCLTLPWPDSLSRDPALQPWEEALALFITSGRGLFERTGARNALDARLAGQILLACQKSMSRVMSGNDAPREARPVLLLVQRGAGGPGLQRHARPRAGGPGRPPARHPHGELSFFPSASCVCPGLSHDGTAACSSPDRPS